MILGSAIVEELVKKHGLVTDYLDFDKQIQPAGFDLTLAKVYQAAGDTHGEITVNKKDQILPTDYELTFKEGDKIFLPKGEYKLVFNETVNLRQDPPLMALSVQRSTFPRSYDLSHVGSFDVGYQGKGMHCIHVGRTGQTLQKNAQVVQLHFFQVLGPCFNYNGSYQKENIKK